MHCYEVKKIKFFKLDTLVKHDRWRDIAILVKSIMEDEEQVYICGIIYDTNNCIPLCTGRIDTFPVAYMDVENWIELKPKKC